MSGTEPYVPIDCNFYDELTALALSRKKCEIVYMQLNGVEARVLEAITDVFTRGREEFLRLTNSVEIRLDHLVSVDGKTRPFACSR